jgi:hypothetical protein
MYGVKKSHKIKALGTQVSITLIFQFLLVQRLIMQEEKRLPHLR